MDFLRNSSRLLSAGTSVLIDLETGGVLYCLSFLGRSSALLGSGRGCGARPTTPRSAARVEHAERDRAPLDALELLLAQGRLEHLLPAPRHLLQQRERRRARVEWQLEDARVDLP